MYSKNQFRRATTFALALVLCLSTSTSAIQKDSKKKEMPQGTPVFWQDPGDISTRNLLEGPGAEMKPDLSSITFIKEETGGYSVKYRVRDGAGREWVAKLGNEARPETASVRLVWAAGYATEINHLVPCVVIKGAPEPRKKIERCEGNGFVNVRFEPRPEEVKRLTEWSWQDNPFRDTKEFRGLIVMMALLNNWDLKDTNNKIIYVPVGTGGQGELRYIISDLGATFGKTGNFITHSRNEPEKFVKTKFVKGVENGKVSFHFSGKNSRLFDLVTVEDAKWIGGILSRLSDQQLGDAFRAANFNDEEVRMLTEELRSRINELVALGGPAEGVAVGAPQSSPEKR
jgi:hypothetical protein